MFKFTIITIFLFMSLIVVTPTIASDTLTISSPVLEKKPADILGFRSAHFGMNLDQVLLAVEKDFNLKKDTLHIGKNMMTHTDSLSVTIDDLLPNTGKAFISYIFGYQSKELIQVNIVWNSAEDDRQTPETILGIGGNLQSYFLKQNFAPDKIATGIKLNDNKVLLLRALDQDKNSIMIVMEDIKKEANNKTQDLLLHISYQKDPSDPDIYKIPDGAF